jgi:hypothetical protein
MPGLQANREPMAEQIPWVEAIVQGTGWQKKNIMKEKGNLELTWPIEFHPRPMSTIDYRYPIVMICLAIRIRMHLSCEEKPITDNAEKSITTETYLLSETTLVTTEKRVIPSSMPGLQAIRGPMAELPLLETYIMATTKKKSMFQEGHVNRVKLGTMTEVLDQEDTGNTIMGRK